MKSACFAPRPSVTRRGSLVIACGACLLPATAWAQDRLPVPGDQAVRAAANLARTAFEQEFAAARNGDSDTLVKTLLEAARKTDAADRKYALLSEAEKAAIAAGNVGQALSIIDERAEGFACDGPAERVAMLTDLFTRNRRKPETVEAVLAGATDTAHRALANDRTDIALAAADLATDSAKASLLLTRAARRPSATPEEKARAEQRQEDAENLLKRVKYRAAFAARASEAREVLAQTPSDAEANATLGSYECFAANAWHRGLPALAKGNAEGLRKAAAAEIEMAAAREPPPKQVFQVAGAWWDASQEPARDEFAKDAIQEHAAVMYRSLQGKLDDPVDAALAAKRATRAPSGGDGGDQQPDPRSPFATRMEPQRQQLVEAGGGTADSEAAVDAALKWLANHQLPDGGWSFGLGDCPACRGQCSRSGDERRQDRSGATALALLPFLGRGYTHRTGPYKPQIERGLMFLGNALAADGKAFGEGGSMYSQGLVGIALAEAYGMSKDRRLQPTAQSALNFIMVAQHPQGGGWRYKPRERGDTSASGWNYMALHSGKAADLQINQATVNAFSRFLDSVQSDAGAAYGYTGTRGGPGTTAVGLLCRLKLGWKPDHPALQRGVENLAKLGPSRDLYFDYYATQVLFHVGGDRWVTWNNKIRNTLVLAQSKNGHETGSWIESVDEGVGVPVAGRLYCTCMAALILETPYRYPANR